MSVLMTLRATVDVGKLEAFAAEKPEVVKGIIARARENGLEAHRFYGTDTEVLVIDRWPSEDAFHQFFSASPEIADMMQAAGLSGEPHITFWHALDIDDAVE